jgi:hypothetical protein
MLFKNKFAGFLLLGSLIAASCSKKLDTNLHNPNSVTTNAISGKDAFSSALINTSYITNATAIPAGAGISTLTNEWMGVWARTTSYSASGTQYQVEAFQLVNSYGDNFWGAMYHNMADYDFAASKSAKGSILPGASKVMQCLIFQDLVDIFGDVPYSQALIPTVTQPKYDAAAAIYADLPLKLDSAMDLINASTATSDDASDVMFKGDKASWLAFANTIKLRILLRQVPNAATAASLQPELSKTSSYGYLGAGQDATVNPGFADAVNQQSPFWSVFGFQAGSTNPYQNNTFYIANQYLVDYLNATGDPRLAFIYTASPSGGFAGNFLGDASTAKPVADLSTIGSGVLKSPTMPGVILLATESLFLQAEAAERGLITGADYHGLFNQAVAESFRYLGVPNAAGAAANYVSSSTDARVNPASASDPIQTIIYQKYVALSEIDGLEQWSDWRRTGYPDRTNPSTNPAANPNKLPKRLLYPQTETSLNPNNYGAEHQQNSDIYTKIFWGL